MLPPKEKAAELISKFRQIPPFSSYTGIGYAEAKQCALLTVDEIMFYNLMEYPQHSTIYAPHKNDYWNEVKQEIEQL
jgi:hypothetical protein